MFDEDDARVREADAQLQGKIGRRKWTDEGNDVDLLRVQIREAKTLRHGLFRQRAGATAARDLGFLDCSREASVFQKSAGGVNGRTGDAQDVHAASRRATARSFPSA